VLASVAPGTVKTGFVGFAGGSLDGLNIYLFVGIEDCREVESFKDKSVGFIEG
jgi:hypothetical protein